jgi:hypothetical protein
MPMRPEMRASRALLASLGASTALVLAGTLALAAVSTVVAFRGWPGVSLPQGHPDGTIVADARRASEHTARHSSPIVVSETARAAQPSRVAVRRQARRSVRSRAPHTGAVGSAATPTAQALPAATPAPVRTTAQPQPHATPATGVAPAVAALPAKPGQAVAKVTTKVTENLGGAVGDTGAAVGAVVRPASPTLADTVDAATQGVGRTVKDVGQTVSNVLNALGGQRAP